MNNYVQINKDNQEEEWLVFLKSKREPSPNPHDLEGSLWCWETKAPGEFPKRILCILAQVAVHQWAFITIPEGNRLSGPFEDMEFGINHLRNLAKVYAEEVHTSFYRVYGEAVLSITKPSLGEATWNK
jgi:hypothetical protein